MYIKKVMQKEKPLQTTVVREIKGKVSKLFHCNEKKLGENTAEKEKEAKKIENDFTLITI